MDDEDSEGARPRKKPKSSRDREDDDEADATEAPANPLMVGAGTGAATCAAGLVAGGCLLLLGVVPYIGGMVLGATVMIGWAVVSTVASTAGFLASKKLKSGGIPIYFILPAVLIPVGLAGALGAAQFLVASAIGTALFLAWSFSGFVAGTAISGNGGSVVLLGMIAAAVVSWVGLLAGAYIVNILLQSAGLALGSGIVGGLAAFKTWQDNSQASSDEDDDDD
ncbi:MAG: hypothetical protein HY904_17990 [Deltaproteobacteria bacterium]|nr:hypothetical protein [Deltaproteobacteria bacterium]